jgi:hypothetical protein
VCIKYKQEVLERTNSPPFSTCHLFEVPEPNLMELNLCELTLISFNSIKFNLTEFTAVKNLVAMVTMDHNPNPLLSKAHLTTLSLNNFKVVYLKPWD